MGILSDNQYATLLSSLGFNQEGRQTWIHWSLQPGSTIAEENPTEKIIQHGPKRIKTPWQIRRFELSERKGHLSIHLVELELNRKILQKNLEILSRKYFGNSTNSQFVDGRDGEIWCLFEFHQPRKKKGRQSRNDTRLEEPPAFLNSTLGAGGFCLRIASDSQHISVVVSSFFGLGDLPHDFPSLPLHFVRNSLLLKDIETHLEAGKCKSIYEWTFPITLPALSLLAKEKSSDRAAKLHNVLDNQRSNTNIAIITRSETWNIIATLDDNSIDTSSISLAHTAIKPVPIEVLEARERSQKHNEIDKLIISGKTYDAIKKLKDAILKESDSLYLARRLILLAHCTDFSIENSVIDSSLKAEPMNEMFLSYAIKSAISDKDYSRILKNLSSLGEFLLKKIPDAENLKIFEVVLPELLGDAWFFEDLEKSRECYQRILERRGDTPRIIRKLIEIARKSERTDIEAGLLTRLATIERRKFELAKIYLRQAEIREKFPTGKDEALNFAIKSLRINRSNGRAASLVSKILIENGKAEEAIQILDGILKENPPGLTTKTQAQINSEIADIWQNHLKRVDLAQTRYEQSIALDSSELKTLESLEAIHRLKNDKSQLARLLELKFDLFESTHNESALRQTFEELTSLYRQSLGRPKRAYELYQRLIANTNTTPHEIDQILNWSDISINWHDLYQRLAEQLPNWKDTIKKAQFLCRLADICRTRLNDPAQAMRHFISAMDNGWITDAGFQYIAEKLASAHDYEKLASIYETRLHQIHQHQKHVFITEMLQIPTGISNKRRDQLALQGYILEPNNKELLLQRFRYYQEKDNTNGLFDIFTIIRSDPEISLKERVEWIKIGITTASGFQSSNRYDFIAELYKELLDLGEEEILTLHEAVETLQKCHNQADLIYFIGRILNLGEIPKINERSILRLLAGHDIELARYHQIMSLQSKTPEIAAAHARTAAAIYEKLRGHDTDTEAMLIRLCTLAPCSEDDLVQLSHLTSITNNYAGLARSLQKQAEFEDEKKRKFYLLEQLAQVYWKKLKDYGRARLTYILAIKIAPEPTRIKLLLAQIAGDAGDQRAEKKALADFLLDSQCTKDTLSMSAAINRLTRLGEEKRIIQKLVSPHIEVAVSNGQPELAGQIAHALIDNQAGSVDIYKTAFRAAVAVRNESRAILAWWNGLALASDKAHAKLFISETRQILEKEGKKELLLECFQEALNQKIDERLGPKIKREVLIQYGALLFDSDKRRKQALTIYREAYQNDPDDSRAWMPLYFLLLEFGTFFERFRHLSEIIPKLEVDPRPLKNFPITGESLKSELKDLTSEIQKNKNHIFLSDESTDQENQGSQSAIAETDNQIQQQIAIKNQVNQIPSDQFRYQETLEKIDEIKQEIEFKFPINESFMKSSPIEDELLNSNKAVSGENSYFGIKNSSKSIFRDSDPIEKITKNIQQNKNQLIGIQRGANSKNIKSDDKLSTKNELLFIKSKTDKETQKGPSSLAIEMPTIDLEEQPVSNNAQPIDALIDKSEKDSQSFEKEIKLGKNNLSSDINAQKNENKGTTNNFLDFPKLQDVLNKIGNMSKVNNLDISEKDPTENDYFERSKIIQDQTSRSTTIEHNNSNLISKNKNEIANKISIHQDKIEFPESPISETEHVSVKNPHDVIYNSSTRATEIINQPKASKYSDESNTNAIQDPHESSIHNRNISVFSELENANHDTSDWRTSVIKSDFNADLTERLVTQAFASELEKHIAIQSVAVVAGNCDKLNSWHWRVWRKTDEYGYKISGATRFPPELRSPLLDSVVLKLVIALGPTLRYAYRERFSAKSLGKRLDIVPSAIEKLRKPLDWKSGTLKAVGMPLLGKSISSKNLKIFNLSGLDQEIFFDGSSHAFYFDENYYRKAPPSHLFHRLSRQIMSLHLRYFIPLSLHPINDFYPLMLELHQYLGSSSLSRLRHRLAGKSQFTKVLSQVDLREVRVLHEKIGLPTQEQLTQLWEVLELHLYRLQLAETLDIIGVLEAITNKDFLIPGALRHSQIYDLSPLIRPLLEFITSLKI